MINKKLMLAATLVVSLMPSLVLAQGNNDFAPSINQNDTPPPMPPPREGPSAEPSGGDKRFGQGGPGQGGFRRRGFRDGQGQGGQGPGGQGLGGPGQGGSGQGEPARGGPGGFKQRMLQRFDANGNGVLDDNEKAQLEAFKEQRGRGQMGGRNSGGPQGGSPGGLPGGPPDGPPGGPRGGGPSFGGANGRQNSGGMSDRIKQYMGGNDGPATDVPGRPPGGPGPGFGPGPGEGGQGGPRRHGSGQMREKMMKRFDANGDGQLDAQEQAAADAARREHRERMQAGGQGSQGTGIQNWGRGRHAGGGNQNPDTAQPGNQPPP